MLPLALILLSVLFAPDDAQNAFPELMSYHVIHISSFFNSTWVQNRGSGWLGDIQTYRWNSVSGTFIFLKPWSRGNFSNDELFDLQEVFRLYFLELTGELQEHASDFKMEYPFEIQGIAGCDLYSGGVFENFLSLAFGGLDFIYIKNYSCLTAPEGGTKAQKFCDLLNQYKGLYDIVENLVTDTCPRYLMGVLETGKADLQKQVKPEVWLSQGPSSGPGHLQLLCHVSGFYPKPVWVMWMRGEEEQPEAQRGDLLPNADDTWYLRVTLDVAAGDASGLSCRVKHSSLGGQDIVLHWGHSISIGWIIVAVLVPCFVVLLFFVLWFYRRWSYEDIL
ncbi:T-cell surface glycoprotein CD1b2 [Octodon degus]|uniref:T-cell surface glycoprotein CD1b2 n=1 Tax=Octodon degus TaxID=10160 RepID=A0A6P3G0M8_OCTDE|nr:T-cell surface glycoprotein CD1b2 [Octodon degus]